MVITTHHTSDPGKSCQPPAVLPCDLLTEKCIACHVQAQCCSILLAPFGSHLQSMDSSVNIRSVTNRAAHCLEQKAFFSFFAPCMQYCNGRTTSDFIPARAEHSHKLLSDMLPSYNFPSYIFLLYCIPLIYC